MAQRLHNLYAIVATDENFVIGQGGQIPWRSKSDMRMFRYLTGKQNLIMGRKTVESLPKKLDLRTIYCLSHGELPDKADFVFDNVSDVIEHVKANPNKKFFVAGGAQIYELFVDYYFEIFHTVVKTKVTTVKGDNLTVLGPKMQEVLNSFKCIAKEGHYDSKIDDAPILIKMLQYDDKIAKNAPQN